MGCPSNLYEINVDRVHTFILVWTRVKMIPQNKWNESSDNPVSTDQRELIDCIMFIVSFENISTTE